MSRKVLITGGGGREHMLAWKLQQELETNDIIYAAPGNPGIAQLSNAQNVSIDATNAKDLVNFASETGVDLIIPGPDDSVASGITDAAEKLGISVCGPTKKAARIETSKYYAKRLMERNNIPTPELYYSTVDKLEAENNAKKLLQKHDGIVIKYDGLAKGKGVYVCTTMEEASRAIRDIFRNRSSPRILIEQLLKGEEVSFMVWTDGNHVIPFVTAQDFKRAYDNDEGPNTGGMGSYTRPTIANGMEEKIMREIMYPALGALERDGRPYKGILYAGLMISNGQPYVLEFNARYGDPETQVQLRLLESSLLDISFACANGTLSAIKPRWSNEEAACIVLATKGYPDEDEYKKYIGNPIFIDELPEYAVVFHAGTGYKNGYIVNTGGRVLNVVTIGMSATEAFERGYELIGSKVGFENMEFRRDLSPKR